MIPENEIPLQNTSREDRNVRETDSAPSESIRVVIADPNPVVLAGVHAFLTDVDGLAVVGTATRESDLVVLINDKQPDVVILDASLCRESNSIRNLQPAGVQTPVLVLTDHPSIEEARIAFESGASGYAVKDEDATQLPAIVQRLHLGSVYVSSSVAVLILAGDRAATRGATAEHITAREHEILELMVRGNNSREIAKALGIKLRTVHTHRARLMTKLDVHSAGALVARAITRGLVRIEPRYERQSEPTGDGPSAEA